LAVGDEPEVRDPRDLRCSDVDRERVAEALREAAGNGRLTLSELDERLEATFKARTYGDLQPITKDLPQGPYPIPGMRRGRPSSPAPPLPGSPLPTPRVAAGAPEVRSERITAILGSEKRVSRWEVPGRIEISCFMGEVTLDFCEAIVRHSEVIVNVAVVAGTVKLIVPNGIDVRSEPVTNILGDHKHKLAGPVTQGGPVYRVRGFILLGELIVRPPKEKRSLFS
jgi:hypothetical protein